MNNICNEISLSIDFELSEEEVMKSCENISSKRYWLFEYVAHVPEGIAVEFDSLQDMEKHLIGESSILNAFTSRAIAIINGSITDYKLLRQDGNGTIYFDKDKQLSSKQPFANESNVWEVEWANALPCVAKY